MTTDHSASLEAPEFGPKEVVYQDAHQEIYSITADFGDFQKQYFVRDSGLRAGIVLIKNDSVLLVRQYRILVQGLSWEVPGGRVEENEAPEQAAIRECAEETGLECRDLVPLVVYQPGLDTSNNPTHIFHTSHFHQLPGEYRTPEEVQELSWIPLADCTRMIANGQITDALTIISLLSYQVLSSGKK
jgi:ADP-ribose pyrophosphatase